MSRPWGASNGAIAGSVGGGAAALSAGTGLGSVATLRGAERFNLGTGATSFVSRGRRVCGTSARFRCISRYESGRITPSADALVRLAQTFNISLDHLLIDGIPRRPLHAPAVLPADTIATGGALANDLADVADVAPGAVILEAYVRVERELRRITDGLALDDDRARMSGRQLAGLAHRHGRLNAETLNAVHRITVLRNLAARAHPDRDDLDTARAGEYLQLADAVLYALRNQPAGRQTTRQADRPVS